MTQSNMALARLLDSFREEAHSPREQGRYFEDLGRIFFRQDAKQKNCYEQLWKYGDWAAEHGEEYRADCGIDLVARKHGGYCQALGRREDWFLMAKPKTKESPRW